MTTTNRPPLPMLSSCHLADLGLKHLLKTYYVPSTVLFLGYNGDQDLVTAIEECYDV